MCGSRNSSVSSVPPRGVADSRMTGRILVGVQGQVLGEMELIRVRKGRAPGMAIILCSELLTKQKPGRTAAMEDALHGRTDVERGTFDEVAVEAAWAECGG